MCIPLSRCVLLVAALLALVSCASEPERPPAIGEAYVGPAMLNLRKELAQGASVTAAVYHGERLEILQRRRRFAKVRTAKGAEGWTDGRMLLSPVQMGSLRQLAERSAQLTSHGRATVPDPLNIHTEPNRQSPSFSQIPAGGSVEVIGSRVEPRVPYQPTRLVPEPAATPKARPRVRRRAEGEFEPPPMPAAPPPPPNWLEWPRPAASSRGQAAKTSVPAVPKDDWSLVRTPDGKAGWVLTRLLIMAIPDEVAQYAEGHRITSYFSIGKVADRGETKHHWLWTTLSTGLQPHQFDGLRIFVWSKRRHQYETAYVERNIRGYYPVEVHPVEELNGKAEPAMPRVSVLVQEKGGRFVRRTYAFHGYRVRLVAKAPWHGPQEETVSELQLAEQPPPAPPPRDSLVGRLRQTISRWSRVLRGS